MIGRGVHVYLLLGSGRSDTLSCALGTQHSCKVMHKHYLWLSIKVTHSLSKKLNGKHTKIVLAISKTKDTSTNYRLHTTVIFNTTGEFGH